jgi:hypothetical protein
MDVRRRGDTSDQLARVDLAVDTTHELVADGLREPINGVRPAGYRVPRCRKSSDLNPRCVARKAYKRAPG